ncbi:GreA/GreB family elongation factor [Egicoccus sp. AB-alg2]|uniref:GreA/GreB family elongation factor n=1 Tax=Egicoccus sp. AB-alg2 TaxID=3242693 RepID=UPI00359E3081
MPRRFAAEDAMVTNTTSPILTAAGRRWVEGRLERAEQRLARLNADLASERSDALLEDCRHAEAQVEELRQLLRVAVSPGDVAEDPSVIELGDEVEVEFDDGSRESFLVVHPVEAPMDDHRTSFDSPLAQAVLGHRPGDEVTVVSPAGSYRCVIVGRSRLD